jgi:XTP/dITP diphosphohydrolase
VELVLGSRNTHKLRELASLLEPHELVPLPGGVELPPESGATFGENALSKARATARATGRPALGEDSGIVVNVLGGAPGIRSARYAGEQASDAENLAKLLRETQQAHDRGAAYVCALAFADPEGEEQLFEGSCPGRLARSPHGSGGFGYDPIFIPYTARSTRSEAEPDPMLTMATLSPEQKNAISHRGKAARLLLEWLSSRHDR